jgi:hypothetical protein
MMSDTELLDWMEDFPERAIVVLEAERDAWLGHDLRMRLDRAINKELAEAFKCHPKP